MAGKALSICFAIFRSIPVVLITAAIVWSYYAYVVQMCLFTINSIPEKILYLIFYHPLIILMMWSFWKTIFTPVTGPPHEFYLPSSSRSDVESQGTEVGRRAVLNQFGSNLPVQCRLITGDVRYCDKCKAVKPDRAHHCSVCGRCILKLDHHCPWVNNCVCFSNYKFFILFLAYGLIYCLYVAGTSLQYFIVFWSGISGARSDMNNLHTVFLFFASIMFAISLLSLFGYHLYLISQNKTTLESFQVPIFANGIPDKNAYNLGCRANFMEVFGNDAKLWFLPIFTSYGDGIRYPTRMNTATNNYNTMEAAMSISESVVTSQAGSLFPVHQSEDDHNALLDSSLIDVGQPMDSSVVEVDGYKGGYSNYVS